MEILAIVRRAAAEALALLLPVDCAGCGEAGTALCRGCATAIRVAPRRILLLDERGPLPVVSGGRYEAATARAIRALKQRGRTDALRPLHTLLRAALVSAAKGEQRLVAVPVPSRPAAVRRRGMRVVDLLVRRCGLRPVRLLRVVRAAADQRALGRVERRRNVRFSLEAVPAARGARVVLVDDVVTTGATLLEARRALVQAGAQVIAAVAVADTPRRGARGEGPTLPENSPREIRDTAGRTEYGG